MNSQPFQLPKKPESWSIVIEENIFSGHVFTTDDTKEMLESIRSDFDNRKKLVFHNISPRHKILLYWPPWNWKTTLAKFIATELGFQFASISTAQIMESLLWESLKNTQKMFNDLKYSLENVVFFLDEIDSLCASRSSKTDSSAGTENNRVVTQFLLGMDTLPAHVIFIWATNLYTSLDPAIQRRFDIKFECKNPWDAEKEAFKNSLLEYHRATDEMKQMPFLLSECSSFNDVKMHVLDWIRKHITSKKSANVKA